MPHTTLSFWSFIVRSVVNLCGCVVVRRLSLPISSSFIAVPRPVQMTSVALKTSTTTPHHSSVYCHCCCCCWLGPDKPSSSSRQRRLRIKAATGCTVYTFITTNKHNQRMSFARYVVYRIIYSRSPPVSRPHRLELTFLPLPGLAGRWDSPRKMSHPRSFHSGLISFLRVTE